MVTEQSWRLGQVAHYEHAAIRGLRNFMLRSAPAFVERRQFSKLYGLTYE